MDALLEPTIKSESKLAEENPEEEPLQQSHNKKNKKRKVGHGSRKNKKNKKRKMEEIDEEKEGENVDIQRTAGNKLEAKGKEKEDEENEEVKREKKENEDILATGSTENAATFLHNFSLDNLTNDRYKIGAKIRAFFLGSGWANGTIVGYQPDKYVVPLSSNVSRALKHTTHERTKHLHIDIFTHPTHDTHNHSLAHREFPKSPWECMQVRFDPAPGAGE